MPIKFRCQHCRQFLGISRAQAGSIVDCPTCGRTIRVPALDGTVAPLPSPGLDPKDSKLAAALDELASIGDANGLPQPDDFRASEAPANAGRDTAMPEPPADRAGPKLRNFVVLGPEGQPIDFDSLPDPSSTEPVDPEAPPSGSKVRTLDEIPSLPPVRAQESQDGSEIPLPPPTPAPVLPEDDNDHQERPWAETAQPGDSWKNLLAAASDQSGAKPDEDSQDPSQPGTIPENGTSGPETGRTSAGLILVFGGVATVLFAAGFWVGRVTTAAREVSQSRPDKVLNGSPVEGPADEEGASGEEQPSPQIDTEPSFRGRITFQADGQRKPDREARVLFLPVSRSGSLKLSVSGFRPGDAEADQRIASAALSAMGGAFALTSEKGEFEVTLPSSGQFHVLVLSNSVIQEEGTADPEVESVVGEFFERPAQLIGRVQCFLDEVRWDGNGTEPLDHSFRN